jgi:hypothetical protein
MHDRSLTALAVAFACGLPGAASAQSNAELEAIRKEIQAVKESYEKRIEALEARLKEAEAAAQGAQAAAARAEAQAQAATEAAETPPAAAPTASAPAQNAFNPGISLILQGAYRNYGEDPDTRGITGYANAGYAGLGEKGFSIDESELTLSANIDQLFYGQATFAVEDGGIEVEEAYAQTSALGHGLTLKGGRAFSAIGYQNPLHPHAWDFLDPAVVQNTFLGKNYAMDAVSASWIAPLPVLVELGGEIGKPVEYPFEDSSHGKNGFTGGTLFARVGGDIGLSHSYRFGGWWMRAENRVEAGAPVLDFDDRTGVENTLAGGSTKVWGLEVVYKWAPDGNPTQRNFKLVAEWMQRRLDGDLTFDAAGAAITDRFEARQSGWYVQGIYQFLPQWRLGLRYDRLDDGSIDSGVNAANGIVAADYAPYRWSAMVDWSPSEYSRLRLQYNQDKTQNGLADDQIFLQYIFSLGAHGAHRY